MLENMTPAIHIHLWTALVAIVLGAVVLARPKGTPLHKAMGRIWVALMLVTAISSFWIKSSTGQFTWIHLLAIWILFSTPMALVQIRRRNVMSHRGWMMGTYAGLMVAGALTLLPDRRIHALFFG